VKLPVALVLTDKLNLSGMHGQDAVRPERTIRQAFEYPDAEFVRGGQTVERTIAGRKTGNNTCHRPVDR
jgi:hypothetical protein